MHKSVLLLLLGMAVLLGTTSSYSQSSRKVAELDSLLGKAHRFGVFNGNVLIAEQGKVIYQKALGQADATGTTKLTEAHRFHIGSIAKEFNAVGIMILKEQGKLRLEDKVSDFLPELPSWAERIQIKHLLQYTSGIPQSNWDKLQGDADNMQQLKKVITLDFEPGTKYAYNNNDVFLQRRIIEKITGMPFYSFVEEKMLKPIGIKNGIVDPGEKDKLVARAYNNQGVPDAIKYPITGWTALTLQDFYKWSEGINSFKLISPASTRELLTPYAPGNQTGLGGGKMEGDRIVTHIHDGTASNYQALLMSNPAASTTILLLTNNRQNNLYPISKSIQAILEGKPYATIKKSFLSSFQPELSKMDGKQILTLYEKVKAEKPDLYNFDNESLLNETGYFLLGQKKIDDAVTVFEYNTKLFPASGNVFDSLGEAYYAQGNKEKALEKYSQALKLEPNMESAKRMVAELKK